VQDERYWHDYRAGLESPSGTVTTIAIRATRAFKATAAIRAIATQETIATKEGTIGTRAIIPMGAERSPS